MVSERVAGPALLAAARHAPWPTLPARGSPSPSFPLSHTSHPHPPHLVQPPAPARRSTPPPACSTPSGRACRRAASTRRPPMGPPLPWPKC